MKKIIVVGSTNVDMIARVKSLPLPGETVGNAEFMQANGGKGANQAVAASRIGGNVTFVSAVGQDACGSALLEQFKNDGIRTHLIQSCIGTPTGTALIFVSQKGENCIAVAPGANNQIGQGEIDAAAGEIAEAGYLLLQMEIPFRTVCYTIEKAASLGVKIVLNPAPAAALCDELLSKLYLITPNETEAEILTGVRVHSVEDAHKAASVLLAKGVKNVIVTLGDKGALLCIPGECMLIPAFDVQAVDTTAAGDVFNGVLVATLADGKSLKDAAIFASKCASVSVTRMGAQPSIPWKEEISNI